MLGSQQTNTVAQGNKKTPLVSALPFIPLPLCQIQAIIMFSDTSIVVSALIHSGSAGNFMDRGTADQLHILIMELHNPTELNTVNGSPIRLRFIMHCTLPLLLHVSCLHSERLLFLITDTLKHSETLYYFVILTLVSYYCL